MSGKRIETRLGGLRLSEQGVPDDRIGNSEVNVSVVEYCSSSPKFQRQQISSVAC